ncbi:glycosyltransferase [Paenibacillus sp. USHLN196]|uniref:glycosyltransferase n=1 Tax=Paenibacillus sp. USHLN196 TaxID=3081291 RepID=UPI00301A252C
MTPTIALCMIVKNEEKVLERCLESVQNIVNEIIIVDTGSTDSTLDIARNYTDKIYFFEWVNDFSAARNESIKHATSDYILILDADEYLDENADFEKDLLHSCDYYSFNISNQMGLGMSFNHTAVRLFKRSLGLIYENRLHEHLNIIEDNWKYLSGKSSNVINHVGYADGVFLEEKKINRNLPLMELEVQENPNAYNLYNMGQTYFGIGKYKASVEYFKKAYPLSKDRVFLPDLLTKLAYAMAELKQTEEALSILTDSINLFPQETEMIYILGLIYQNAGYYRDSEICYRKCIELGDQGYYVTEGSGGYMSHLRLSELYEQLGRLEDSLAEVVRVLELKNNFIPGVQQYLRLFPKLKTKFKDFDDVLTKIYVIENVNDLQLLLNNLYGARNPILEYYLTRYKINAQPNVVATAKIYSKKYVEAKLLWSQINHKEEENGKDLLLLSVLLQEEYFLEDIRSLVNLSNKEMVTVKHLVSSRTGKVVLTTKLENILLDVCMYLIILEDFDKFQWVAELMIESRQEIKFRLSKLISDYGFDELAIDLLISTFKDQPNNVEVVRLLGDLCFRNNYFEDAHLFYTKLLALDPKYNSYERSLNYYEKVIDVEGTMKIKREMEKRYPYASHVKKTNEEQM